MVGVPVGVGVSVRVGVKVAVGVAVVVAVKVAVFGGGGTSATGVDSGAGKTESHAAVTTAASTVRTTTRVLEYMRSLTLPVKRGQSHQVFQTPIKKTRKRDGSIHLILRKRPAPAEFYRSHGPDQDVSGTGKCRDIFHSASKSFRTHPLRSRPQRVRGFEYTYTRHPAA